MSQKITYKIGADGGIDDSKEYDALGAAIHACRMLWLGTEHSASVYGHADYSEDDKTPIHARTYFWRAYKIDEMGRVSEDGR